ncbi:MAG: hypothetical protein QOH46_2203 [Solirubrobacteraceae bacterium]|nr:hypothetical protein [Solirubrobacteraceae bacterium]
MSLRLEGFELRAFGPFTATELDLRGSPSGALHVICGPNEVGKSTAQRGIGDFFFGIPPRSSDNQLHDYVDMRLAAVLIDEHGRRHELVRRKGARSTLLGPNGDAVDEGLLDSMLRGMTREVFESMFSITHDSLVVGGKALLAADGNVGESLFSASLGATGLHELRAELDARADALFRPRATSSLVLQARSAFEDAQARQRETTLRATTFAEHERELRSARGDRDGLVEQIRDARADQNGRERLRTVIPLLATREQAREELESLAGAPELPDDAGERRAAAVQRAATDRQNAEDAKARVEDLGRRIAGLPLDTAPLGRELAIKDLHGRLASVREGAGDLERQRIKLQTARDLAQRALEQVRPDLDLESAEQLRLTDAQRAAVDRALQRHAQLSALLQDAEQAADEAHDRARELAAQLDGLDAPPDVSALDAAVADARADGQVEQRLADARSELGDAIDRLEDALRRLDPPAEVDALRAMRAPSRAAVERLTGEHEALDVRARELADRRARLDQERRDLAEELSRLALSTNVPTVEDLSTARAERDEQWRRVRRRLDGAEEPAASPEAFEGNLRHADDVADRLRSEADGVARRAQVTVRERRIETEYRELGEQDRELAAARAEHVRRWAQAWASTGIEPGTPREMTDWLRTREAVLERADVVAQRRRASDAEERTRDGHIRTLGAQLTALGVDATSVPTLSGMLALAGSRVGEGQDARAEYERLARDLRTARATAGKQREKSEEHRGSLERWEAEWAAILAANGWPAEVGADGARQVLATVTELARQLDDASHLTGRVTGIQDRIDAFGREAGELVAALDPDLASWPAQDAVAELERRLARALRTRSSRETLEGELQTARESLASAEESVAKAERDLQALVELAGVATIEELPEAERRSARAAELRAQLPELERQITEAGRAPLRELLERANGVDIDLLDARSHEADEEIERLEEQLRRLDVRIGELGGRQEKLERLDGAAGAAEDVEHRAAELRELTERYLRLYLAAWALSEAIDAYRKEHKAPLLKRADELFPRLTRGRFQGLEVSFDEDDEPVLVGVRSNGEKVPVKHMSTGTREQLYLALRLASLERHVELHGPMPVILDDVVLHSDPQRKAAILAALADLGRRTQVIAFTHDPQVVALAQNAVDPDMLTVHELGGTEITGALQPQIATAEVRPIRPAKAA